MIILSEADRRRVAMRRALRALAAQGEPAGWQGRWLDMSAAAEGWSDWRFIDTIDIERWEKRCKDKPNYYMMRPLYAAPVPSGTNYPALIKQYIPAPQAQQGEQVAYTTGHCENHKQKGGCQLHNLHCRWPNCDRKPVAAPAPQAQPLTDIAIENACLSYRHDFGLMTEYERLKLRQQALAWAHAFGIGEKQ